MSRPIKNLPQDEAPLCTCGCTHTTAWNRRKNRWNRYVVGHYRKDAPYKHEEWLRTKYLVERKTLVEIANECGVEKTAVNRYMKRFGVTRRNKSESRRGRKIGALNPAWKGGVADWDYSFDWKVVAKQIKDRDKWTCQDCGEQRKHWGINLHVHHIDANKLNNNPSNLVSLCARCHRRRHGQKEVMLCEDLVAQ